MNNSILVFDLETIPDTDGLAAINSHDNPEACHEQWQEQRLAEGKSDFMPLHLHRIVCISVVFRKGSDLTVHTFAEDGDDTEADIIRKFFHAIEKHEPQLVSWNGGGFDLPVLHYRGLLHGISAPKYWDMGEDDRDFRWNNYISRYHARHLDLMDLLALYQPRNNAPLDALAKLCGFPGKLGVDGSQVFDLYRHGDMADIIRYCETDVMNTYLMYCRFQLMRGGFTPEQYHAEIAHVRQHLQQWQEQTDPDGHLLHPHWQEYLQAWQPDAAQNSQTAQTVQTAEQ